MSNELTNGKIDIEQAFSNETLVSSDGYVMPYRLYVPKNYDCGETYPLMIFLHGAGERGSDNKLNIEVALPHVFDSESSPARKSIIIAPQCPEDRQWVYTPWERGNYSVDEIVESRECEAVMEILKTVASVYNVDRSRIYVTGLSMGGFGTWDLMARHSDIFAAGMPVCGGGDPSMAKAYASIPIRTFHGAHDGAVPVDGTRELYAAIKAAGGRIKYVEFEDMDHGIWDDVYSDRGNIWWLFSQVKKKPAAKKTRRKNSVRKAGVLGAVAGVAAAMVISHLKKKNGK